MVYIGGDGLKYNLWYEPITQIMYISGSNATSMTFTPMVGNNGKPLRYSDWRHYKEIVGGLK